MGSSSKPRKAAEERTRKVVAAEARAEQSLSQNGQPKIRLSSGVELLLRPVSKHFIYEATKEFQAPQVPMTFNEDKGRNEENPIDPDYLAANQRYLSDLANAATDVALLRGTMIKTIPDGVPEPDSETWIEEMEILHLPMRENSRARYLSWLKAIAAPLDSDINKLLGEIGRLTGVSEADVTDAVDRFRRIPVRNEDPDPSIK